VHGRVTAAYNPAGEVIPGGDPLTDRHNTAFAAPDEALINDTLLQS
jgi:hypothetical protein